MSTNNKVNPGNRNEIFRSIKTKFKEVCKAFDNDEISLHLFAECYDKFSRVERDVDPSAFAKNIPTLSLKEIIRESPDAKLRAIAHAELNRRANEEKNKVTKAVANTPEPAKHSEKILSAFAKDAPGLHLKKVVNESPDAKLRAIAHAELRRRETEEKGKVSKSVENSTLQNTAKKSTSESLAVLAKEISEDGLKKIILADEDELFVSVAKQELVARSKAEIERSSIAFKAGTITKGAHVNEVLGAYKKINDISKDRFEK